MVNSREIRKFLNYVEKLRAEQLSEDISYEKFSVPRRAWRRLIKVMSVKKEKVTLSSSYKMVFAVPNLDEYRFALELDEQDMNYFYDKYKNILDDIVCKEDKEELKRLEEKVSKLKEKTLKCR